MAKNNKVWTPAGYLDGPFNSLVGKGESIIDYTNGTGTLVTKGKVGVDNQPSSVEDDDLNVIAGNDIDMTNGMTFAQQMAPYTMKLEYINKGDKERSKNGHMSSLNKFTQEVSDREKQKLMDAMKQISDRQQQQHQMEDLYEYNCGKSAYKCGKSAKYKCGKSAKFDIGTDMFNLIPTISALGAGWQQYRHWKNNPIEYHDTYAANPYENRALSGLASLRYNPYPELQAANDAERRAAYSNENAGLSAGQRYLGRLGLGLGAMQNRAKILANAENQNNQYKTNYYNAALSTGAQDAQRKQQANQYGWSDYVAAHGKKTKGIETAMSNINNALNSWVKNVNTYRTNRDTIDLYRQQVDIDRAKLNAYIDSLNPSKTTGDVSKIDNPYDGVNWGLETYVPKQFTYTPYKYSKYNAWDNLMNNLKNSTIS